MKMHITLIAAALFMTQQAQAIPLSEASALANKTSQGSSSPVFNALELQALAAERTAIQNGAPTLSRDQLKQAKQSDKLADYRWLKASGYNFQTQPLQQAGIALLSGFSTLPDNVMNANRATVTSINLNATQGERRQALADAEGISYLYFLADALGPRLGKAFLAAYEKGELSKAAALIKASEVSTSAAKKHFDYPRPFLHKGNTIHLVPDDTVIKDNQPYTADGGSFPSGHTNTGYTDALLLAEMIPERFDALLQRGARYGYSRLVLGVHYPLDVMGSRMVAQYNVAHYLNDAAYRTLFAEARQQLRSALEKECGTTLAVCAKPAGQDDPYGTGSMKPFYRFTMSYNLPKVAGNKARLTVPDGAEVLLETALPQLSAKQRRALMVKSALPAGYPLGGPGADQAFWQRLDLDAAYAQAKHR
ncbi:MULTISPECIES: acid phosphatase [Pantoea]|uniref:Phosphoesterase PA-phosphatase n=1 Tax=Pantoea stewartii TaxID=66269 RepID=A0AB34VC43_9GAMM|nr:MULTISPECIES: phosphatase PAP2 family protein [Pantoea]KHD99727.1 phosphoesterase PA-phosphatase [Pantoea stewartii]KHN59715.1 phosphoesterase PA-phosphatase [Pantoea stewartii]KTS71408.1 phosphoesterase PA-phosphatase [Pantoea stewartii]KTS94511.1 phosphoesterase PA-phosphatase [Pantoea stewartii]KTT08166.1 phosphoesterase PA-phosphatase [Pantoea stewartii]